MFSITAFPFLQEASASLGTVRHDDSQMREMREALKGLQIEVWYASLRMAWSTQCVCAFTCILALFRIESLSFENKHLISLAVMSTVYAISVKVTVEVSSYTCDGLEMWFTKFVSAQSFLILKAIITVCSTL